MDEQKEDEQKEWELYVYHFTTENFLTITQNCLDCDVTFLRKEYIPCHYVVSGTKGGIDKLKKRCPFITKELLVSHMDVILEELS